MAINVKPSSLILDRGNALAKDLVYAIPFVERAGTKLQELANHADATTTGAPTWDRGLLGAGLSFNGSSQYATIPDSDLLDTIKKITVSMWFVKTATTTGYGMFASRATDLVGATDLWLLYHGDSGLNDCYSFEINTGSASYLNSSTSSDTDVGTLVNITGTYDGVNMKLYKNGIEIATAAKTGDLITGSAPVRIAAGDNNPSTVSEFAPIKAFSLVISRRGWTPTEVRSYYTNPWQIYKRPRIYAVTTPEVIAFESAANSGDIAAASSYSGSASWSGNNRALSIDVSMLGAGVTVTAMTYGGAACTFVGAQSTVTSFGRIEQWRIIQSNSGAPAAGANTLVVTLSGSLEFTVEWTAYSGIHQTSPTEGFNSAQATNVGVADNATVNVTTVADNAWVHAAVVANDTSITAGNTTRNNISGTLGSGANEDNGAAKTPAGAVTMFYTGMGITTTWAIAGYALRPVSAAALTTGSYVGSYYGPSGYF